MHIRFIPATSEPLTDNAPLWCLCKASPAAGMAWKFLYAAISGTLMDQPIHENSPVSGVFVVPVNSKPETIADANGVAGQYPGVPLAKRGMPLSMECVNSQSGAFPGGGNAGTGVPNYFFECNTDSDAKGVPIPEGYTVLAAYIAMPGTAAPGPGAGSQCIMNVAVIEGTAAEIAAIL